MKKKDISIKKNWKSWLIFALIVIVVIQVISYKLLYSRILDTEERLYTDLHRVQVDVLKLQHDESR